jgi:hypothetical protein
MDRQLAAAVSIAMATTSCLGERIPEGAEAVTLAPERTYYSGYREASRLVIRDEATWSSAWETYQGRVTPRPAAPAVDFTREMVLLAAMGERSSGGYSIQIDEAAASEGALYVAVTESSPGAGCVTSQSLSQPVVYARVPQHADVRFIERLTTSECR